MRKKPRDRWSNSQLIIQLFHFASYHKSAQSFDHLIPILPSSMALHRVRLDSPSSGGFKHKKYDQDDEMTSEKQRLDIIEVLLSLMPVIRDIWLLSFIYIYTKERMLSMHHQAHVAFIH